MTTEICNSFGVYKTEVPEEYSRLVVTCDWSGHLSLKKIDDLRTALTRMFGLSKHHILLAGVTVGSVIITFFVPKQQTFTTVTGKSVSSNTICCV